MLYPCKDGFGFYHPSASMTILTENGNFILDTCFSSLFPLPGDIKSVTRVVESELFIGYNPEVIIAGNKRNCLPQQNREFYLSTKSGGNGSSSAQYVFAQV